VAEASGTWAGAGVMDTEMPALTAASAMAIVIIETNDPSRMMISFALLRRTATG
jgi:hypothetical protein